jgi:hypothetical protein
VGFRGPSPEDFFPHKDTGKSQTGINKQAYLYLLNLSLYYMEHKNNKGCTIKETALLHVILIAYAISNN